MSRPTAEQWAGLAAVMLEAGIYAPDSDGRHIKNLIDDLEQAGITRFGKAAENAKSKRGSLQACLSGKPNIFERGKLAYWRLKSKDVETEPKIKDALERLAIVRSRNEADEKLRQEIDKLRDRVDHLTKDNKQLRMALREIEKTATLASRRLA